MKTLKTILVLLCLAFSALAQDAPPADPGPLYAVAMGVGFNHAETPQAKGWVTFARKISDKNYSLSTMDTTSLTSSVRTGYLRNIIEANGITVGLLADIGVATGGESVAGAATAGGVITYDLGKVLKTPGAFIAVSVRAAKIAGTGGTSNTFGFGVGKTF